MTKEISMKNLYDGRRLEMNFKEVFITGKEGFKEEIINEQI